MKLVEFVPPKPHPLWKLCLQMGITDVIVKVNPDLTGLPDPWKESTLRSIVERLRVAGLRVVGLEGDPFDMAPIKQFGEGATGGTPVAPGEDDGLGQRASCPLEVARREEALAHYRELLESMAKLDIHLLCYNFMVGTGWARTGVREGRGGAKATYFNRAEYARMFRKGTGPTGVPPVGGGDATVCANGQDARWPSEEGLVLTKDRVWANYEYFIKAVMPTAERVGVRMGLHPDDPCLPELGGYARIFETVDDYDRAYSIYPSPSNAVTFCQANFKLMITPCRNGQDARCPSVGSANGQDARCPSVGRANGQDARCPGGVEHKTGSTGVPPVDLVDVARHFGKRIAFIHVRDVEGDRTDFTELFHDQGTTDQFALMRTYRELGLDVPVRGDHVPEMEGDRLLTTDCIPGYFTMGRLFANGYLKALLKGTEK